MPIKYRLFITFMLVIALIGCRPPVPVPMPTPISIFPQTPTIPHKILPPSPSRPVFSPGQLVDYIAQTGDNLPALASHFNTTEKEIRQANPIIPVNLTTLPPGLPMKIPIYYQPLWGSAYQIIPDSLFINGPAQINFDPVSFVNSQPGWFKYAEHFPSGNRQVGGEIINTISNNFSVSPRLLLAILEYQTGALSDPNPPQNMSYILGFDDRTHEKPGQQIVLAANMLNNAYYLWRTGQLKFFEHLDGRLEYPDPWQNTATVALQYYFSRTLGIDDYNRATQERGLALTYQKLFGDPWAENKPHIPGSLQQPYLVLPFQAGKPWTYTGGPHTGWGKGEPFAAIDFAPPAVKGCSLPNVSATAAANGIIARTNDASLMLDLDGDGDDRTGWVIFYLHLANSSLIPAGRRVRTGDPLGLPSCEGGEATGTHVHIARKYNGEWIPADGILPFNLEGWIAQSGDGPYIGKLVRYGSTVRACACSDHESLIEAEK